MKSHRFLRDALPPVVVFFGVLGAWHLLVLVTGIKPLILPGPLHVWSAFAKNRPAFTTAVWITAQGAISGFLLSLLVGTAVGVLFSQSRIIRNSLFPYAIFLQTVPIVAVAPLIIIWFGYGLKGVIIVSFIISVFPIITNATAGMSTVSPDLLDLFRLHNASRWQMLWKLRLPHAVPHIITGARTASGLAVIGAIVGEFFVGAGVANRFGIGYLIHATSQNSQTDQLFAAVILATLMGVAVFAASGLLAAWLLPRFQSTSR